MTVMGMREAGGVGATGGGECGGRVGLRCTTEVMSLVLPEFARGQVMNVFEEEKSYE